MSQYVQRFLLLNVLKVPKIKTLSLKHILTRPLIKCEAAWIH